MIRVNLLPHRELKRAAQKRNFAILAGGVAVIGLVSVLAVHTFLSSRIDNQGARNTYLKDEITRLDKEIEDIKKLKEQIQAMLARKQVVEGLQSNRTVAVHLLDELVRRLPEGVYLSHIKQEGNKVRLTGYAQSNARVSTLMRSLEASDWLGNATLIEIKAATVNNLRASEFAMTVMLDKPAPPTNPATKGEKK